MCAAQNVHKIALSSAAAKIECNKAFCEHVAGSDHIIKQVDVSGKRLTSARPMAALGFAE